MGGYKEKLIENGKVRRDASVLIVVGRDDTGALEAQVRGSRYAWEMRLISIEALIKLVQVKEKSDDPETLRQIQQLLKPFEYTKIDRIIDVVFTTTLDVEAQQISDDEIALEFSEQKNNYGQIPTPHELVEAKRKQAIEAFAKSKGKELVKQGRATFWSPDKQTRACCAVSKYYDRDDNQYWYGFTANWDSFLAEGLDTYFVLSCMDRHEAYAIPYSWISANKENLNVTERAGEIAHWHFNLTTLEDGSLAINVSKIGTKAPLSPYSFKLS